MMTTDTATSSFEVRQKAALADLSSLGRVSHRLALVDASDRLSQVLEKLLPRLLKKIGNNHQEQLVLTRQCLSDNNSSRQLKATLDKVHAKLVEMLSHTMKRVRDDQACRIPCREILHLLLVENKEQDARNRGEEASDYDTNVEKIEVPKAHPAVDPFTLNLSLAFLTLGLPRCESREEMECLLPGLLVLVGHYSGLASIRTAASKSQSHQIAHLLLRVIERLVKMENDISAPKFGAKRKLAGDENRNIGNGTDNTTTLAKSADSMELAREVCRQDPKAAAAVFDLLLDGLLYQPVAGSVPPSGLSSAGHERLKMGSSKTERDWAAEKAPRMKLCEFKLALLDFAAPSRRWALFMPNKNKNSALGVSRTVGLLVAASGDPHPEVLQRASTYLKIHHDSFRGAQLNNGDKGTTTDSDTRSTPDPVVTRRPPSLATIGDAASLTCTLLMLALGQTNAESAMARISATASNTFLGIKPEEPIPTDSSQLILSLKRRAGSESTIAAMVNYVATKVFEDNPQLFNNGDVTIVQQMATLPLMVSQRTLAALRTASGLSVLQAKPYVAAASLLNILTVRVASFFDSYSLDDAPYEEKKDRDSSVRSDESIRHLLASALFTACSILAPASTSQAEASNSALVSNEGSIAVRDGCYGVICTLSRSRFALAREGYVFTRGSMTPSGVLNVDSGDGFVVSTETALLLFGCAANEVEHLRPRAVAALDALLGAYCRVYCKDRKDDQQTNLIFDSEGSESGNAGNAVNPWGSMATAVVSDLHAVSSDRAGEAHRDKKGLAKTLLPILWSASQSSHPKASRVASARWSTELLKHLDLSAACHLLCFLAGDEDVTASNIAREGLSLPNKLAPATFEGGDEITQAIIMPVAIGDAILPAFGDYTAVIFPANQSTRGSSSYWRPQYWDFSFAGKSAAIRYGLMCLFHDIYGGEDDAVLVYLKALGDTLILFGNKASGAGSAREGGIQLLEECAMCLLATVSTSPYARRLVASASGSSDSEVALGLEDICYLAQHAHSSRARRHLAGACGHLYDDLPLWDSSDDCGKFHLRRWLDKTNVHRTLEACSTNLADMKRNAVNLGETTGLAILGAQCIRAFILHASRSDVINEDDESNSSCWQNVSKIIAALGSGTQHADEAVGNTFADGLAIALSYSSLDAPILDQRLYSGTATALTCLATAITNFSSTDHLDALRTLRLARAAGHCLAASTSGAGTCKEGDQSLYLGPARIMCVDSLFSLLGSPAYRKDEEIALVVGEALALYGDASPETAVWSSEVADWPAEFDEKVAAELPPHQQVLFALLRNHFKANSPHKRTACAAALLGVVGRAVSGVNKHATYTNRPLVREIIRHFGDVLDAFIKLLSDPKSTQLSRESACLGLAACRGLASSISVGEGSSIVVGSFGGANELNQRLLRAFGQTTNFGGSAYQESNEQAAARRAAELSESGNSGSTLMEPFGEAEETTQVGGAAGLGEASLGAYREMASAAVNLGRHDVLYALLLLSVSHSVWFTPGPRERYSASSLLGHEAITGSNAFEMRRALRPHLGKLLPRILRASHDPNKQTREQMSSLWVGITGGGADARSAITEHLCPTIDSLIEDASHKLWRARVGACGALAEVIVGRSWHDLGGGAAAFDDLAPDSVGAAIRLLRLWRVAMRALDDVRAPVRENGEMLARAVRGLSIRLCDPYSAEKANGGEKRVRNDVKVHEKDATAAAATTLRWLIKNGLNQQCAEATGICISCLVEVIDVVRPALLQPLIPDLLKSLLCAMSGLEPAALNYLQVRSGAGASSLTYEELERARLRLASSGPIASAVQKLLDMLPSVTIETQQAVVQNLDEALRVSVGFATRAATADAVSALCSSCPNAFSFPGTSNTNPSVRLLRALYFASERERGQGARDKVIHALGNLAGLCPGSSVRSLAKKACEKYNYSTGNNDDPSSRRAAASAIRAIAVRASNQLSDGGPSDIWFRNVFPVSYLGQHDADTKISSLWKEVWEEGSSICSGKDTFGTTTEENLLPQLVDECCKALNDVSWSRRVAGSAALSDLCLLGVLAPAPRSLQHDTLKDDALSEARSLRRAKASSVALTTCVALLTRSRLWTGKSEVLKAAVGIAAKWSSAVADEECDDVTLFGWDADDPCPWKPIVLAPLRFEMDLLVGDSWFAQRHDELEPDTAAAATTHDEMDVDDEVDEKLNFDDCTNEVGNEDDMQTSEHEDNVQAEEMNAVTFTGLCRFLLDQGANDNVADSDEWLPYRTAAFTGFRDLMASLNESKPATEQKQDVFKQVWWRLISLFDFENRFGLERPKSSKEVPVLIARAIDGLASCFWNGFGSSDAAAAMPTVDALELVKCLRTAGGTTQPAWTVRESACLCVASLAAHCHLEVWRNHTFVSTIVECATQSQKDRKFWRVRYAGLKVLSALVTRTGIRDSVSVTTNSAQDQERLMVMEAMLPHKESILKLARSSLGDSEAKVTALSSDIIGNMSWWP